MINLYQNQMADSLYNYINQHGHVAAEQEFPSYACKMNAMLRFKKVSFEDFTRFYDCVAEIDTDDLEDAFRIGNYVLAEKMKRISSNRYSSMSVGDVCELGGKFYQVMSFGFEEIV